MRSRSAAALKTRSLPLALALVVNLALAGGPGAGEAHACSCASAPLKSEIKRSDAVFSGEVRRIDENMTPGGDKSTMMGGVGIATGKVSFAVRDSWKGVTSETVDVYGQGDGVNCYNTFEAGEAYIVYASRGKGTTASLKNNECGATKPLAYAEQDLRVLGSPLSTLPDTGGPPLPPAGVLVVVVFLACAGVLSRGTGDP